MFGVCQILNEINRGYLVQKGTKGILKHEGTKPPQTDWLFQDLQDDPFGRLRAGRIFGVEGAWRVLRGNTLWIKTGRALSKRASSGPASFDPATLSPCEAWFG